MSSVADFKAGASRPARGGWIEIGSAPCIVPASGRPAPHGAGGLKSYVIVGLLGVMVVPPRTGRVD